MKKFSYVSKKLLKDMGAGGGGDPTLPERVTAIETEIGDSTYTGDSITDAINAIQTKLTAGNTWTEPTLLNGVVNSSGTTCYKRFGDVVTINLFLKVPSENTPVVAFQLPDGYRPAQNKYKFDLITALPTGNLYTQVIISSNGNVTIVVSGSGNIYANGTITFLV